MLLEVRRVDVKLELAGTAAAGEAEVRERSPVEVFLAAVGEVLRRNVRVVRADEPRDVGRLGARDDRLEQSVLGLVSARRHRRISLPGGV